MKSPWKFLAQLIPQRRSAEPREGSIGHDADTDRSQSEAQQSPGHPLDSTEDPRGSELDESRPIELLTTSTANQSEHEIDTPPGIAERDNVEEFHAAARRKPIRLTVKSPAQRVESGPNTKSTRTAPRKELKRAKRTGNGTIVEGTAVAKRGKSSQFSSPRDTFFDEVASLEEDIKQLRIQLARKLRSQNDQLKKLLERFDV